MFVVKLKGLINSRNTGADIHPVTKRMAYNKSRWNAANQSKIEGYEEEQ
jgi:hypothetical protein